MEDKTYKILNVQAKDPWSGTYGTFNSYALQLEGIDGWVEISQMQKNKDGTMKQAPQVGYELFGHLEPAKSKDGSKTYMKFKKASKTGGYSNGGGANIGGYSGQKEDNAYIITMLEELTLRIASPENPQPRDRSKALVPAENLPTDEDMNKPFDISLIPF